MTHRHIANVRYPLLFTCLLALAGCHHQPCGVQVAPSGGVFEYASFYAEVAGDFANPIDADAPAQYVWTTESASVSSGDISEIYKHFGLESVQIGNSMNEIEISMVNHLCRSGWSLAHFNNYSVRSNRQDIQTVYRYLFKRPRK